jgi:3-oxoacyl-[acyl-carrier protein] reductase
MQASFREQAMDLGLTGKRALVMGASKGLGRAVADALAAEGARLVISSRKPAEAAAALGATGIAADVDSAAEIDALADGAMQALGGVDILVLNHGGPPPCTASDMTAEQLATWFPRIVAHPIRLAMKLLPGMRAQKFGRIIIVGSAGMKQPIANLAISNTLRAAMVGWAKTLSNEVAAEGVTVNVLAPGAIRTDRSLETAAIGAKKDGVSIDQWIAARSASIPAGRYGAPEEYAAMAVLLASPRASYVTGTVTRVDGGMVRGV